MATKKPPKGPKKPKKPKPKSPTKKKKSKRVKRLPSNARVLYPDKKWRDRDGNLADPPALEPAYRINSDGTYTRFSPTVKHKKTKQASRAIPKAIPKAELGRATLEKILGERKLSHSPEIAAVLQEGAGRDLQARLKMAHASLASEGIDANIKFAFNKDLTIDSEIALDIGNTSIGRALYLIEKLFKIPPGMYASIGWRWEDVPDVIVTSFPLINTESGEVTERKTKNTVHQLQTNYSKGARRVRGIFTLAEKSLGNVFDKARESGEKIDAPRELFLRIHWNPYDKEPTRQE